MLHGDKYLHFRDGQAEAQNRCGNVTARVFCPVLGILPTGALISILGQNDFSQGQKKSGVLGPVRETAGDQCQVGVGSQRDALGVAVPRNPWGRGRAPEHCAPQVLLGAPCPAGSLVSRSVLQR